MSARFDNRCLSPSISHPPPVPPPPRFSDVQLNSLPTYRRALQSERLQQAIEKSCPMQMMTVQVGRVFLIIFLIKYLPHVVNPLSPPPPPPPSQISLLSKKPPFQGKEVNKTAALLSLSSLPSPLSFYSKTSFGGSGREIICSRVKSSDLYSVILGCITSNFLYLSFPLCILVLPVD